MKQGDRQYEIVCKYEGKYHFDGRVVKSDKNNGFWQIDYDLLPLDANVLVPNWDACADKGIGRARIQLYKRGLK